MNLKTLLGTLTGLLIIALGVGAFILFIEFDPRGAAREARTRELLENIANLENNYPQTPDELMEVLFDIQTLVYGNYLTDPLLLPGVVQTFRLLLAREFLELNPFDSQHRLFLQQLYQRQNEGITQTRIQLVNIIPGEDYTVAHVAQSFTGVGLTHWRYYLVLENGYWKIQSWFLANEEFERVRF